MEEKENSQKGKLFIEIVAKKINGNNYSGTITATNEENSKKINIDYICENPLTFTPKLDIKFLYKNEKFNFDESEKILFDESKKQKYLIILAFDYLCIMLKELSSKINEEAELKHKGPYILLDKVSLNLIFDENQIND
jgi:hypothetical protein